LRMALQQVFNLKSTYRNSPKCHYNEVLEEQTQVLYNLGKK